MRSAIAMDNTIQYNGYPIVASFVLLKGGLVVSFAGTAAVAGLEMASNGSYACFIGTFYIHF